MKRILSRVGLPQLVAVLAVTLVLGSGTAYAAKKITGKQIKDNTVSTKDIKDASLTGTDVADASLSATDILDGTLTGADIKDASVGGADITDGSVGTNDVAVDSLTAEDLATSSVGQPEIATDGVGATEIQNDSIDFGEVVDFGLTNQDIGVLFAQVQANGTLDNSSGGGVTVTKLGVAGNYEVDFARNIQACAFTATIGPSGGGSAAGEVNVADRGGNAEAVFVDTNTSAGAASDLPFSLVVVC